MGMDLLLVITELPDESVTTENACGKIAEAIRNMGEQSLRELRDLVAYAYEAEDDELIEIVQRYFIDYRAGNYHRNVDEWDTFDADGNPRTVTIFGCESWGDAPEAYDAGLALHLLPERWWT